MGVLAQLNVADPMLQPSRFSVSKALGAVRRLVRKVWACVGSAPPSGVTQEAL